MGDVAAGEPRLVGLDSIDLLDDEELTGQKAAARAGLESPADEGEDEDEEDDGGAKVHHGDAHGDSDDDDDDDDDHEEDHDEEEREPHREFHDHVQPTPHVDGPRRPKPDVARRSVREPGGESPEHWSMSGYLNKLEWRAPTQCGCIPIREKRSRSKFVAINTHAASLVYSKTRGMMLGVGGKSIMFSDVRNVTLESENSRKFRVVLKTTARAKYKGREYFEWAAVNHESAMAWTLALQESILIRATVYTVGSNGLFPESELGVATDTAVCFSGGGARAHVACTGQLRALQQLRLLNEKDISYISAVSGSAWATSIYMFYEEGAANDDELLGSRTRLDDLDMVSLRREPSCPLIAPATVDLWRRAEQLFWTTDSHEWWNASLGDVYLKPFGLNDHRSIGPANMNAAWTQNSRLLDHVRLQHKHRPFWVANCAVLGPSWAKAGDLFPVQITPLYTGTPFNHKMHLRGKAARSEDLPVGGLIDTYAFGTEAPTSSLERNGSFYSKAKRTSLRDGVKAVSNVASEMVREVFNAMEGLVKEHEAEVRKGISRHAVRVPYPEHPLTLQRTIGIASHAPAFLFKNSKMLERFNPRGTYWAPSQLENNDSSAAQKPVRAQEMDFADGGVLDNIGLLSMLQRKVKRAVVFINSEVPVPLKAKGSKKIRRSVRVIRSSKRFSRASVGSDGSDDNEDTVLEEEVFEGAQTFLPDYRDWPQASILPLFGIEVPTEKEFGTFNHNQVFDKKQIIDLLGQFQQAKVLGEPLIARQTLKVRRNDWWHIDSGWHVEVLWVYTEKCRSFELQLPRETLAEIDKGRRGAFERFPLYKTFGQKKHKRIEPALTVEQANLLAAQTEWTILSNSTVFKSFLRGAGEQARTHEKQFVHELAEKGFG